MRKFFVGLLIVSLLALGGTLYWRAYHPEAASAMSAPTSSGAEPGVARDAQPRMSGRETSMQTASSRQDLAVTISILSSIISALAAVLQAWFTRRAMPPRA